MLARIWGLLDERVAELTERRRTLRGRSAESEESDQATEEMARALAEVDQTTQLLSGGAKARNVPGHHRARKPSGAS